MFNNSFKQYKTFITVTLIIVVTSLLVYFFLANYSFFYNFIKNVVKILEPITYGIILAYLISPVCDRLNTFFLDRFEDDTKVKNPKKWAHTLSVALSVVLLLLIVLLIIMLIIPQLIESIANFINRFPHNLQVTEDRINELFAHYNIKSTAEIYEFWNNQVADYFNNFMSSILPSINNVINDISNYVLSLAKSLFNFLIGFIVCYYCLDKRKMFTLQFKKLIFAFCSEEVAVDLINRARNANEVFLGFIIGKLIDSLIIGIICLVFCTIFKFPSPVLISVIIGITNIIPFFGPFLGAVPTTIIILLENPLQSLYFVLFILALQQFDGNILGPKILGDTTGITPFWVLFSILLFGGLWGIIGMIIGVPLFVVLYNLIKEITNYRLEKKGLPTKAYKYDNLNEIEKEAKEPKKD